jgi:hypothetical protein
MNEPLTTVAEIKAAVARAFGRDWLFTVLKTGGWQQEMSHPGHPFLNQGPYIPTPTGNLILELENGSSIMLRPRVKGVQMHVKPCWAKNWPRSGQMRFNPRYSTVKYAVKVIRKTNVIEDFDLLQH